MAGYDARSFPQNLVRVLKKSRNTKLFVLSLLAAAFFLLAKLLPDSHSFSSATNTKGIANIQAQLQRAERELNTWSQDVAACLEQDNAPECLERKANEHKVFPKGTLSFLVYKNDSLVYWSDNRLAFAGTPGFFSDEKPLIKYRNGWFLNSKTIRGDHTVVAFALVKNEYSYQNKYLSNVFSNAFDIPAGAELGDKPGSDAKPLLDEGGRLFAYYTENAGTQPINEAGWFSVLLLGLAVLSLLLMLREVGVQLAAKKKSFVWVFLLFSGLVALRWLSHALQWPAALYASALFDPRYFASSTWLNSLGDMLLNTLLIFYCVSYLYRYPIGQELHAFLKHRKSLVTPVLTLSILLVLVSTAALLFFFRNLIINSGISFNVGDIFSIGSLSIFSFVILALLFSVLFLLADGLLRFFKRDDLLRGRVLLPTSLAYALFLVALFFYKDDYSAAFDRYSTGLFALTFPVVIYALRFQNHRDLSFSRVLVIVLLFAFISAFKISIYNIDKEKSLRMLFAEKLDKEKDHVAEHLFEDIEAKVASDTVLCTLFDTTQTSVKEPIGPGIRRLHQVYFNGYWSKYDSKLHTYDAVGKGLYNSNNENVSLDYFDKLIRDYGQATFSPNFIFLNFSNGRTSYIARLPIYLHGDPKSVFLGTILVELDSKLRQEESGFPDLLLSNQVSASTESVDLDYSYARYQKGKLTFQSGEFPYYLSSLPFGKQAGVFMNKDDFNHYVYRSSDQVQVIVSVKNRALLDYITLFSYLFAFFLLFMVLLALFGQLPLKIASPVVADATFSSRIQQYMMLIVLVSLLITGSGTAYYIMNKYHAEQYVHLRQRVSALLLAVQNQLGDKQQLDNSILRNMTYDLMSLSLSSGVDFNLYDLEGKVLFSTQPKLYEQEIIAERMNANAFGQLQREQRSSLMQDEQIGGLQYIAAYESVRNADNTLIGYLGLPFFSRQSELKKEISSFLIALINIYVLLFGLALILAYLITERITQPLKVIRQRISKIRLGSRSEPMVWEAQDEIGELIREYNRMVNELAQSAELLAKSERESAWREMARQVAHEIKNPLTPMKLSVQYLERAWNDKAPDMEVILKKISRTLIEQIDTLSHIASEFSNFAQMPKARNEQVDVKAVIQSLLPLFIDHEQTALVFDVEDSGDEAYTVFADRDQLSRVFTNLINNALQSIPENQKGLVRIVLSGSPDKLLVEVSDNGTGIDEALAGKIFEPNFTTKSSGMGLGLAMVKSIVEQAKGRIWFETVLEKGTRFFVELPRS